MQKVVEKTLCFRRIAHFIQPITKKSCENVREFHKISFVFQKLEFTHSLSKLGILYIQPF